MTLSINDVKRIADLAHIEVNEDETKAALVQLSNIFNLIEEMQLVDTSTVEPMSHAQDVAQRLRDDVVTESDQHELFQSIAPQVEAELYLVPKVIE
ncbi:aspartyl/glutamyl-tRNA(Asn/Gln) amidotransferase subunit C [Nitrosomonas cryotolerans]|uniref:Aspartyl/glutamyl-tRNA(Asn/Gln) amidotransferase subunit C n=1 Tax=Nitrosomonas cryotolerans ATCC 49181 TaxID=1131553 RepID=A0A1N6JGX9_9PROT|nr:Asp-tRNA(Asn)/Glu-tRNA(Gln) amidotransferase subunit GatC [Nitrosomonas cryotolerans]SFP67568.1 aspartyl/glutamyl-tRNA(Asn/Gln) amidotransferase subunit C [Nitrosomonas cryotolerans]SIO43483.1 aspartyl/glutamyl-tRNA(Asn/Gln) amidotransferase subunit C [Nitrosomonas cryotolerans ATCC 49181]